MRTLISYETPLRSHLRDIIFLSFGGELTSIVIKIITYIFTEIINEFSEQKYSELESKSSRYYLIDYSKTFLASVKRGYSFHV